VSVWRVRYFVAPRLVRSIDPVAHDRIDRLVLEATAREPVDPPEREPLRGRASGVQRDWARDKRELQIALPVGAGRRHEKLQRNGRDAQNPTTDVCAWSSALQFPGPNESLPLPDLGRFATHVAAEGRGWGGGYT